MSAETICDSVDVNSNNNDDQPALCRSLLPQPAQTVDSGAIKTL